MANYTYNPLGQHTRGDTLNREQYQISINDVYLDLTTATINCMFRVNNGTGEIVKDLTNGSGITVLDAINGHFQVDSMLLDLDAGKYVYDIEIIIAGEVNTYIKGDINVSQDVTYV